MTDHCGHLLTSYEPVVEALLRVEFSADGWSLWVRHRHYGGLFADCQCEEYSRLTSEELADVLTASVLQWGPVHGPSMP
jgi:hypothetical protein